MFESSYIVWNVSPEILQIGPISIRWYGVLFAAGFFLGYLIVRWMFQREGKPERDLDTLLLYMVAGTVVGARLGHVLFYDPVYYFSHPFEIIKVWRGGLASHGGAIGILIALYLYSRKRPDQSYLWILDRMAVPVALAGSLIRLGNLFNSEILGLPTDVPWAVVFVRVDMIPRHPAQIYEAIGYFLIFVLLFTLYYYQKGKLIRQREGLLLGLFLSTIFSWRFIVEFVKVRQAAFENEFLLSVGQLLSIPAVIAGIILVIRAFSRDRNADTDNYSAQD